MNTLSKDEFIKLYPNTEFYKILNRFEIENGITFKTGLNNTKSQFLLKDQIDEYYKYIDDFDLYWIRQVFLNDDTEISFNNNIFFADTYILGDRFIFRGPFTFKEQDEKLMVSKYGNNIKYIDHQTEELCKLAIEQNPKSFIFIKNKTPEICMLAVKKDGLLLEFINKQPLLLRLEAVKQNGLALKYVNEQKLDICYEAVKQNGLAIQYIKYSPAILKECYYGLCLIAVRQNGLALEYINQEILNNMQDIHDREYIYVEAVKQNGLALKFIKDQSDIIISEAIKQNGLALKYNRNNMKCRHCNKSYLTNIFNKEYKVTDYFCLDSKGILLKCKNFIKLADEIPFIKNIYKKEDVQFNENYICKEEYLDTDKYKMVNYMSILMGITHIFDTKQYEYRIMMISMFDYMLKNYKFLLKEKKFTNTALIKFEESIKLKSYIDIYNEYNINYKLWHEHFKNAVKD